MLLGIVRAQVLRAVAELRIADYLADGAQTARDVAGREGHAGPGHLPPDAPFRAAGWDLSRPKAKGWEITPASMAAAAAATGQTILGPPLTAGQMIRAA